MKKDFKTYNQKQGDLAAKWYLIDADGLPLGRISTEVAKLLIGKHKPTYTPHFDNGDYVVVVNSDKVLLTGRKEFGKIYYRHSGYIGNLRQLSLNAQRERNSTKIIYKSVGGMLPKNKLKKPRLARLKVYASAEHPHQPQQPTVCALENLKRPKNE